MTIIRPAKIKDLPEVVRMRLELSKYHETWDYFKMNKNARKYYYNLYRGYIYSSNKKLLVAEDKGKLIGFGSAHIVSKEPIYKIKNLGHIRDMYVDKKFRRQGVAGKILSVFYKWFKEKNGLTEYLKKNMKKGDAVLFKASHGMNLGEVVNALISNF